MDMDSNIITKSEELKALMKKDPRIIRLDNLEKELYKHPELVEQSKKMNDLVNQYELALKIHPRDSKEVQALYHQVYEAKLALDKNPIAKEYNEAFIAVNDLYMAIDDIIFGPYRHKILVGENHD
jgi:predicted RND superfamily exporter protein